MLITSINAHIPTLERSTFSQYENGIVMTNDEINPVLKEIYGDSKIPVAVAAKNNLWENNAFKKQFGSLDENEKAKLISDFSSKEGISYQMSGDKLYTVNVISYSDCFIIEVIHSDTIEKMLRVPAVKEFMRYVFARLRQSVTVISVAADEIYALLSSYDKDKFAETVPERLNSIDASLMDIISAVIDPEQLFYLLDDNCTDSTVCIMDELKKTASSVSDTVCAGTKIETRLEPNIYARMNRSAFNVIITDMITKCYHSSHIPDKIIISSERTDNGEAVIKITSEVTSVNRFKASDALNVPLDDSSYKRDMFFDYVVDAFCSRCGGSFTIQESGLSNTYSLTFPAIRPAQINVSASNNFDSSSGHFGVVNVRLRRLSDKKRYGKIL